ncbi:MAG: AMP-binding protein [Prevotellaceae bacterium]|nr:AMP-binding protein [Prevotella sp.]MDD6842520.1 AMP-binding protein [Prevotellaceae bacterium]
MNTVESFNSYIEKSIKENWDRDALTDYKGATLQYHDVARKIEKLHILFENSGVVKGDKIAICGRNSAPWAAAFFSILTYGAVAVPILHEFNAEQIHNIVNHSGAKILFVGDVIAQTIDPESMPDLEGIINIPDYSLMISRSEKLTYAREHLNELFGHRYPNAFRAQHVSYHKDQPEELALLNYTSGTTGFSKGVMLPYRAIWGNLDFCFKAIGSKIAKGSNILSILPMAHMYGMAVEFMFPFCHGCHLFFLTRLPSPAIIKEAMAQVKPAIVISVPLVVDKIIRKGVFPKIQNNMVKLLLNMPVINKKVKERICQEVHNAFGGNAYEVVVGGAALNQEIEHFLYSIGFPITVGYGATECAPLITFSDHTDFVPGSCGTPVDHMEVKILSSDPQNIAGEIVARGTNTMLGYYKNEEATRQALDEEGWYHTGDLATMSADGHVFIRGRIKNMLLGSNGQNVYPEEIEDKLNSMAMVNESIVIQRENKFVALVYPDIEEAHNMGFTQEDLENIMEQNRQELNSLLPAYSQLSSIQLHEEEFAKTPKKSIKRYLYK